jgi:putative FmdB family regulatory protein
MPIYSFECKKCGAVSDVLRKVSDYTPPDCICGKKMERIFTPVSSILKGAGWSKGQWSKLRKRSVEQGKKFFRRHPDFQEMGEQKIAEKAKLEN